MKICLLTIATRRYTSFLPNLYDGLEKFFLKEHDLSYLLFSDNEMSGSSYNIKLKKIDYEPWPMNTLKRFHYFLEEKEYILNHDYVFYF